MTTRPGWYDNFRYFEFGSDTVKSIRAKGEEERIFHNEFEVSPALKQRGSLLDYQSKVLVHGVKNPLIMFEVSKALSGPLLEIFGLGSGGTHDHENSSFGKSTKQRVGASVYGDPREFIVSWRTTDNGLEAIAMRHNNLILILDESSEAPAEVLDRSS